MQDLKADAVRFLTRETSNDAGRDRDAAKLLARCEVDVRHVAGEGVDVLIRGSSETVDTIKTGETAGRLENALREASDHTVCLLQWVESSESDTARPGSGAGDGSGASGAIRKGGPPTEPHFESGGHGSGQSPAQPGDRTTNPPPNPRR